MCFQQCALKFDLWKSISLVYYICIIVWKFIKSWIIWKQIIYFILFVLLKLINEHYLYCFLFKPNIFFFFFNQATELLLYGRRLTADQALRHGLVSEVLWHSNLMNEVIPRVQIIVSQPLQVNILHWNSFFIITTLYQKQWANLVLKFLHLCISWLQCHFRASKSLIYCIRISVDWFNLEILQKHMREFIDIVENLLI